MPAFTYAGDAGRIYPTLQPPANTPDVGTEYELDEDPGDGRWTAKKATTAKEEK